jgi:hypothetical protein
MEKGARASMIYGQSLLPACQGGITLFIERTRQYNINRRHIIAERAEAARLAPCCQYRWPAQVWGNQNKLNFSGMAVPVREEAGSPGWKNVLLAVLGKPAGIFKTAVKLRGAGARTRT